jgi:hypothetical protein
MQYLYLPKARPLTFGLRRLRQQSIEYRSVWIEFIRCYRSYAPLSSSIVLASCLLSAIREEEKEEKEIEE